MSIDARLSELGITLPQPAAPVAAYVPAVEHAGMLYVSGQLPFRDGQVVTGEDLCFRLEPLSSGQSPTGGQR